MKKFLAPMLALALLPTAVLAGGKKVEEKSGIKFDTAAMEKSPGLRLKSSKQADMPLSYTLLFTLEKNLDATTHKMVVDAFSGSDPQKVAGVVVKDADNVIIGNGTYSKASVIPSEKGDAFRVTLTLTAEGSPATIILRWNPPAETRRQPE